MFYIKEKKHFGIIKILNMLH